MTMNYSYGKENIPFLFTVGYIGYMIFHLVIGGRVEGTPQHGALSISNLFEYLAIGNIRHSLSF